jgi:hypothetical protein
MPSLETFTALLADAGLQMSEERVSEALAVHTALATELPALRAHQFPFLGGWPEPSVATQWIENGGVSA